MLTVRNICLGRLTVRREGVDGLAKVSYPCHSGRGEGVKNGKKKRKLN